MDGDDGILIIDKDSIDTRDPDAMLLEGWFRALKTTPTLMRWQDGPFRIYTLHSGALDIDAEGAYVAVDDAGYPYPLARAVYDATYQPLESPALEPDVNAACAQAPAPSPTWFGPSPTLADIVHAKNEGLINEDEAKTAARKMLLAYGLADSGVAAQINVELERVVPKGTEIIGK